jgi:membrane fusion protein, heavy metal efflux system
LSEDLTGSHQTGSALSWRLQAMAALGLALVAGGGVFLLVREPQNLKGADSEISSQARRAQHFYQPTDAEWVTLTVESVQEQAFRTELVTEGVLAWMP